MISISENGSSKIIQFDGTNFSNWKYRLGILLDEKGLRKYIEQNLSDILKAEKQELLHENIKKEEKQCISIIVQSVHDTQLEFIKDKLTAKAMFEGLSDIFERKSLASQLMYRRQILTMKMQSNESMNDHFLNFDKVVRDLKSTGANVEEQEIICLLFLTLPKTFDNVITALETINPKDLSLDFAKSRLLDEYNKRSGEQSNGKTGDSHAMSARDPNITCFNCGKKGHIKSQCRSKKKNYNQKKGNSKSNDDNKNGDGAKANSASNEKNNEMLLCAISHDCEIQQANACVKTVKRNTCSDTNKNQHQRRCNDVTQIKFILDSGATEHMVNNKHCFNELIGIGDMHISVAKKNQRIVAKHRGSITVKSFFDGKYTHRTMKNVLYVPDLHCNLMSVRNLTKNGYEVKFENDCARIMKNGKTQFVAHSNGRLYEVTFLMEGNVFAGIAGKQVDDVTNNLWHFRLGHLNAADMKILMSKKMVDGINGMKINDDDKFCETCVFSKHTKLSFPRNNKARSKRVLELIHSDVCGPMSRPAWDGSRYFVTFTDDFSRATMIYCIERKSEVFDKFKEYVAMCEAMHGSKIARLKTDNGGEYSSNEFKKYCAEKGIQITYTVPYNPQMNSIAERLNRTLMERARAMLHASGVDWKFWNEAVITANYLKNRCPTKAFGKQFVDKTPAEIWFGAKPDLSIIKVFGSTCYNHIPTENRKKLDTKSEKCIMLGYGATFGTYRIWDVNKNKLIIGRHVTFNERPILNRAKIIEISDSEAASEEPQQQNNSEEESSDELDEEELEDTLVDETDESFADANDKTIHDTNMEGIGNIGNNIHGTKMGSTGDINDKVHGVMENNTGNNDLRRSKRIRKPVDRYGDFEYDNFEFGNMAHALSANEYVQNDPISLKEAGQRSDWPQWKIAVNEEYSSLMKNNTWSLCKLPRGRKTVSCKWVFKLKQKANGEVDKYKARLVARGFTQSKGFDYNETYSPTAKLTTFRVLLAIAVQHDYYIHQMDVKCAFLNGHLNEEIYMNQPEGFENDTDMVCKLNKSLYGLKQASRMWNERFHKFMSKINFKRCLTDHCLYTKKTEAGVCYILLYVDDLLIVSGNMKLIKTIKLMLLKEFEMTDLNEANNFLGINIVRNNTNKITMDQTNYFRKMLQKFGMSDCKGISTPIEVGLHLENNDVNNTNNKIPYRELIGCITYATLTTRPDLCAATNFFSRFQSCYDDTHFQHAKRMLRYIQDTKHLKMVYEKHDNAETLVGYADADFAGDKNDRKSTSGFVFKVYGNTISWSSKKQPTVSLSSTEAEYIALGGAICEGKWLRGLLHELDIDCNDATIIHEDNQSTMRVAEEPREHQRMKHIDVKYNFIRDSISNNEFKLKYIPTGDQTADIMTKGLGQTSFVKHRKNLNLS